MRVHVFGCVGALALAACGSEAGPGPAEDVAASAPAAPEDTSPSSPAAPAPSPSASAPAPAPKLGAPYPIVLMHGMAGFGKLEVGPVEVTYFKDVVEDLTKSGEAVYVTLAPPYATSEVRAAAVASQIDAILARTGKAKVNLVGHSQGGLDARVVTSPGGLGYGDRVASVTTVATPHHGTKVADAALGLMDALPGKVADEVTGTLLSLLEKTAYELDSDPALREQLRGMSVAHMEEVFNPTYVDAPGVVYLSYAGRSNLRTGLLACEGSTYPNDPLDLDPAQLALAPTALFLEEGKGKVNDGLVTVESAKWGTFEQCVPADHLKEIGLLGPTAASFDHLGMFRDIVARVRAAGL